MVSSKADFPIFACHPELIYLDHAATSQKPQQVIDAMSRYLTESNGSPHRGAHKLSVEATRLYDIGRKKVAAFIGASRPEEVVFTKNATEALNLIAYTYGLSAVKTGDEIVVAITSHHSNIVPWQMVASRTGATLKFMYVSPEGDFLPGEWDKITDRTTLVAFPWVSNSLGVIHDISGLIAKAHAHGAVAVVDAAQAVGHLPVDVCALDADFLVFSGHKMYGPTGIGVLYGKHAHLQTMPPFLTGGDMIEYVEEQSTTFAAVPERFEAGTQHVEGVVGLMAAMDFIEHMGLTRISEKEQRIARYAVKRLSELPFVRVYGPREGHDRGALVAFEVEGIHPHDLASILDDRGIAIRAGHHCTQPLMKSLGIMASCRASFSIYNHVGEVDALVEGLHHARRIFGYEHG